MEYFNNYLFNLFFQDCHGKAGRSSPVKDSTQNYKVLEANQNETHTFVKVSRPWDTCDRKGDVVMVVSFFCF